MILGVLFYNLFKAGYRFVVHMFLCAKKDEGTCSTKSTISGAGHINPFFNVGPFIHKLTTLLLWKYIPLLHAGKLTIGICSFASLNHVSNFNY